MKTAIKYFFVWIGWMFLGALLMLSPAMILGFAINGGHIGVLFDNPWTFSLIMVGSQVLPIYVFWRSKYANFSIHKSLNLIITKVTLNHVINYLCLLSDCCKICIR